MIAMKLEGGARLARALAALTPSQERTVVRRILVAAAAPIRARAQALAPVSATPPHLRDHIAIGSHTADAEGPDIDTLGVVSIAIGPEKPDYFYGLFQEFGTAPHGTHPGQPARPFLRPALDEQAGAALRLIQDGIWAWLRDHRTRSATGGAL